MKSYFQNSRSCGCCFIVPPSVLRAYAADRKLDPKLRATMSRTITKTVELQQNREGARLALVERRSSSDAPRISALAPSIDPIQQLFDCKHTENLPGRLVDPESPSADEAAKSVFNATSRVADFFQEIFGRNSINNRGLDLVSSVHYDEDYNNAFWNGQQMVYGDGDGSVFIDFWRSPDVIGHELTHGITQYESGLRYIGEPGALNESISDVFGAVFHQWLNKWPASEPKGWLIGAGIMGKDATAKNKTCLRDMLKPGASHCLSRQPDSYEDFIPGGDVHQNSGIPNKAFAVFAQGVGGNAWDKAVKVWYTACTERRATSSGQTRLSSTATFLQFARLTIEVAGREEFGVEKEAQKAWQAVNLPLEVG